MRRLLCWLGLAVTLAATSDSSAQTADELRAIYSRRDIARMEEIARSGDVRAEAWMGLMLQNRGRRLEAKQWWRRAAEKGNQWAIVSLANMHLKDKEDELAVRWYARGAETGDLGAQHAYARLLLQGRGVDKDEQAAARLLSSAASRGHRYSYPDLARLYANGTGVTRDPVEAYAHVKIAEVVLNDSDFAAGDLARLKERLTAELSPSQISAAGLRARAMRPDLKALRRAKGDANWIPEMVLWVIVSLGLGLIVTALVLRSINFLIRR